MHRGFLCKASNNAAEYEVLIASLRLAKEVGAQEIMVYSNSSLVVNRVQGSHEDKDPTMAKHMAKA